MAKSTKHGGASLTEDEWNDPRQPDRSVRVRRPELGRVDKEPYRADDEKWHGKPLSESSETEQPSDERQTEDDLPPVPTMESHSSQTEEQVSDAPTTDGDTPKVEKPSARKTRTARVRTKSTPADDFDF